VTGASAQFKRQLPRNFALQILLFGTQVGIGIWLVPYLIQHVGIVAYGLITLAAVLTDYVGIVSQSIAVAVNRFLTISLQRNDLLEANRIFSTAFFTNLAIGLAQLPFFFVFIWYADSILTIPHALHHDMVILLVCSAATFVMNLVASIFGVPLYANNRLDILRMIDIARYLLRAGGIVTLFIMFEPSLRYVGYVYVCSSLLLLSTQAIISKRLAPTLRLGLRHYDWGKIRQLVGMSGWTLINSIGGLLFLQTDIFVCNRFIGPAAAGEYAALLQWPTLIRAGGAIIAAVAAPMLMIYYARSELGQVVRLSQASVRALALAVAVPIAIICLTSSTLLRLWLGPGFTHLAPLMVVMLFHLVINVGVVPLLNVQVSMNKVRKPAVVTLITGALNLALAIAFITFFDWGIYGVAIAGAIALTAKNAIWMPIYTAGIMHKPWHTFIKPYMSAVGIFLGVSALGATINQFVTHESLISTILYSVSLSALGYVAAWLILPKDDRRVVLSMLPARFRARPEYATNLRRINQDDTKKI